MHDVRINEKYEEIVKEAQLMRDHVHRLEHELENTKEALRKQNDNNRALVAAQQESGEVWSGGSNMLCYAPVAAMSYWRRWMGRPDDVHNS